MKLLNNYLAVGSLCLFLSAGTIAQVQTETKKSQDQPTVETKVERGEVVTVSGNDLVVKMEDGQIRHFANVPESARVTVDGQQLSVHDLKPGMKLERTITTTTTPQVVTTVKTVTGTVFSVSPPRSVILRLEDGTNEQFTIPEGQKFMINGKETDAFGLRKGMQVSATKVVEVPENVITQQRTVTGQMPPPPPAEPIQGPILIVSQTTLAAPPAPPAPAAAPPAEVAQAKPPEAPAPAKNLPQTATDLPLLALIGTLLLLAGALLWGLKRRAEA